MAYCTLGQLLSKMRFPGISKAAGTCQVAYCMVRHLTSKMRPPGIRKTSQLKAPGSRLSCKMGSKQSRHGGKAGGQASRQAGLQACKQACRQAGRPSKQVAVRPSQNTIWRDLICGMWIAWVETNHIGRRVTRSSQDNPRFKIGALIPATR